MALYPTRRDSHWQRCRKCRHTALLAAIAAVTAVLAVVDGAEKVPYHDSLLSGENWLLELKLTRNPHRFKEQLGMKLPVFLSLVSELERLTNLGNKKLVSLEEQVAIFLYTVTGNESTRKTAERFQHSTQTISRYINSITDALNSSQFYNKYVRLPPSTVPPEIEDNPKYYPFFRNILASIDGSHISATPPTDDQGRYRNRKGTITQNVLLSCTFDMRFCHVLSGWEGSVADGTLFNDARAHDLKIPRSKQYLADAGFPLCNALLVPYRGVRYHLKEWGKANLK